MIRFAGLFVALTVLTAGLASAAEAPKADSPAEPEEAEGKKTERFTRLNWRDDVDAALEEARATDRLVMVYFHADWCQPCKWMEKGPFAARKMSIYLEQHFVPVRIDDTSGRSPTTEKYGIRMYPSILVLDHSGQPLHLILKPQPAPELHAILEQVRDLPALFAAQEADPDDLEANFALGSRLAQLEQLRRAEPFLEKAAALDPENEHGRLTQAALMLALVPATGGDADETLRNLDLYVQRFPDAPEVPVALHAKGTLLYENGRLREARQVFSGLRERFPRHAMAYKADQAIRAIDARLQAEKQSESGGGVADPESASSD